MDKPDAVDPRAEFEITGNSKRKVYVFIPVTIFLLIILGLTIVFGVSEGFNTGAYIAIPFCSLFALALGLSSYFSLLNKTIRIEGSVLRYYMKDALKKEIKIEDIRVLEADWTGARGQTKRTIMLKDKDDEILLELSESHLTKDALMHIYVELVNYKDEYDFEILDNLEWIPLRILSEEE